VGDIEDHRSKIPRLNLFLVDLQLQVEHLWVGHFIPGTNHGRIGAKVSEPLPLSTALQYSISS
jgi:hypothetical protein